LTTEKLSAVACLPTPVLENTLDALRAIVAERTAEIHHSRETLTMGDFWTGNVMVTLRPADIEGPALERVHVIDWELVKPGVAALDIGQFCAEMHTFTLFRPDTIAPASALIDAFLTAYRVHCGTMALHTPSVAAKHMGAVSSFRISLRWWLINLCSAFGGDHTVGRVGDAPGHCQSDRGWADVPD
jgi:5-methylthioribose kinase